MHYALQRVCPGAVVLDAFDVNHAANEVYAHNFGRRPKQVGVTMITNLDLNTLTLLLGKQVSQVNCQLEAAT
jgi:hypothetical protein